MAAYLRCKLTGEVVSACYPRERDLQAALGDSEFLEIDDWMAAKADFPRRTGIGREVIRDRSWRSVTSARIGLYERAFHAACQE